MTINLSAWLGDAGNLAATPTATEAALWTILLSSTLGSTLCDHIMNIVGLSSKKKMMGINTCWIIATRAIVQDIHIFRHWSVVEFPTNPVGDNVPELSAHVPIAHAATPCASPEPAIIWVALVNLFPKTVCNGAYLGSMARYKAHWISLGLTPPATVYLGDGGQLTTAAHAQSGGIGVSGRSTSSSIVPADILKRLSFYVSQIRTIAFCKRSRLTAAAFTEFYRGFVRGMIAHVVSPFLTIGHATGRVSVAVALLLGNYRCIIPCFEREHQCR